LLDPVQRVGNWLNPSQKEEPVKVKYQFQKLSPLQVSPIEAFGRDVERVLRYMPTAVPDLPFAVSSRACSGILDAMPEGTPDYSALRLASLEADGHILLKNIWGHDGRLDRAIYSDGQIASYEYDRQQRLSNVKFSDTSQICFEYADDGALTMMCFGKTPGATFVFERSSDGTPIAVHYPSGSVRFTRDAAGDITYCTTDVGQVEYLRQPDPKMSRVCLTSGEATFDFHVVSGKSQVVWSENAADGTSTLLSPMGIHQWNEEGRVWAWLRWDGQYMKLFHHANGMVRRIWSTKGVSSFEYATNGKIISAYRPDGTRYYWHREEGRPFAVLVGPGGAVLLRYDSSGRPTSIMDSWGSYVSMKYGQVFRGTLPRKIKSPMWGCVEIKYEKMNRISSVAVTGGGHVSLKYSPNGKLSGISWRCPNYATASRLLHLVGWLWTLMSAGKNAYMGGFEWSYWVF
jgi:hypothetical protein